MNFSFRFYWSLLLRRLPVMLAMLLVCSALGFVTALNLPPTYTTSARLIIEDATIETDRENEDDATEQLQIVQQRLMTRANLIDIANKFRVFEDIRNMTPDAVIEEMQAATSIRLSSGRRQANSMTISFEARTGRIAADVVNEYVTLIQQDASSSRQAAVGNTLEFFEQEVARLGQDLDQQSIQIVNFKGENSDALPDDLDYRLGRQALLQERLGRLERDKASIENQRSEIVAIFQATGRIDPSANVQLSPEEQQLNQLRLELQTARATLSETNPKVALLRNRITQLETALAAQRPVAQDETPDDPQQSLLDISLAEIDGRVEDINVEVAETREELEALSTSIAATSANTIALAALQRDFDNIQNRYNTAVDSLDRARVAQRVELTQKGQRLDVVENARVPVDPSGPNRVRIAAMGVGMGLALAGGFFLLLEFLNRTIRRPAEIQNKFNITPIATIPYMESEREKLVRRALLILAVLSVLVVVPSILWYIDTNLMPLELIASKLMSRIGL